MDGEGALLVDHCMPGVGASRRAGDALHVLRERIDDLAFPLIPPLSAEHNRHRHSHTLIIPRATARSIRLMLSWASYPQECTQSPPPPQTVMCYD